MMLPGQRPKVPNGIENNKQPVYTFLDSSTFTSKPPSNRP